MAESRIKVKASVNEIHKNFEECPSKYYYIKYYDGEKNYKGNNNEPIVFEVLIRHNEIGNRSIERPQPYTLNSLEEILNKEVKKYIKEQISLVEERFAEINKIDNKEGLHTVIDNCAFILDGIDMRNQKNEDGEKEKYPKWATEEVIDLIEDWSYWQKELLQDESINEENDKGLE